MRRSLGIELTVRGFGFVVVEERPLGDVRLVDWGLAHLSDLSVQGHAERIREFIERYQPASLTYEEVRSSRRGPRARSLIPEIVKALRPTGIECGEVSRRQLKEAFRAANQNQIARALAEGFPELVPYLPKVRKAWQGKDERMAVFLALGASLVWIGRQRGSGAETV